MVTGQLEGEGGAGEMSLLEETDLEQERSLLVGEEERRLSNDVSPGGRPEASILLSQTVGWKCSLSRVSNLVTNVHFHPLTVKIFVGAEAVFEGLASLVLEGR